MSQNQQTNIEAHILARFTIIKKIGSGAYGHVWKVQDKINKKIYALKKIFDAFQHSTDAQRTYREIQILKQIEHSNIIKLYESIKADNNKDVYLIFEYMQADLHNVIAQGILKQIHIKFIIYQLTKALKYLHSGLIIHRDLKPSNILINSNCTIKLCDFGLVRSLISINNNNLNLTQGVATRWYRAPQVLLGSTNYSTPADIWSFGCIIYQILYQKPMFAGDSTSDQINKILMYTGYPTQQQLKSIKSNNAKSILKQSKISTYIQKQSNKEIFKDKQKDISFSLIQLIKRMTIFNPNQRITVDQILAHQSVQQFRKKQQQIQCQKIIMTQISDNKKLTVDQYRNLIYGYGLKKVQNQNKLINKKSSSYTQLNSSYGSSMNNNTNTHNHTNTYTHTQDKQKQKQKQRYTLKYVKSKQLLKNTTYNSNSNMNNTSYNYTSHYNTNTSLNNNLNNNNNNKSLQTSSKQQQYSMKQQITAQSRKQLLLKDPTRLSYISKNFYSPKNIQTTVHKNIHNYNSMTNINNSVSYNNTYHTNNNNTNTNSNINNNNNGHSYLTQSSSLYNNNNNTNINNNIMNNHNTITPNSTSNKLIHNHNNNTTINGNKIGSYTSSNTNTLQKKPILFKSSKYMINKTEQSTKQ